ncbi:MAG TPA: [acyl-carrier-protein] S-malonyltransferase [Methylophilaceae bacterium]|nr:[acyl-carrier-protein] S-malonyltransferase [Methylophilaceae bacterium]
MSQFAFFFPGQGSQSVGMMSGLADLAIVKQTFVEASDTLKVDFWSMVNEPNELLNLTQHTQPLMLTAGVATWRAYQQLDGAMPAVMAGHSLAEYTALVAAGALRFEDALPLVRYRAEVMQHAVPEGKGGMAAILGLEDDLVREVCLEAANGEVVEAVNFNSPGQVVIAGEKSAIDRAVEVAKAKGAKRVIALSVSVPSHCALMKPAAKQLAEYLKTVKMQVPSIPVLQNADVASYREVGAIQDALARQLYSPVRWVETVQAVYRQGITMSAECGPGKVLSGLVKRSVPELTCISLVDVPSLNEFVENNK